MDQSLRPDVPPARDGWFAASLLTVGLLHFLVPAAAIFGGNGERELQLGLPLIMGFTGMALYATAGTVLHAVLRSGGSRGLAGYLVWGLAAALFIWHVFLGIISEGHAFYQQGDLAGQQVYFWGTAYVAGMSLITAFIGWWFRYRWKAA